MWNKTNFLQKENKINMKIEFTKRLNIKQLDFFSLNLFDFEVKIG